MLRIDQRRVLAGTTALLLVASSPAALAQAPKGNATGTTNPADPTAAKGAGQPAAPGVRPAPKSTLIFTIDVRWPMGTAYRIERDITTPIERAVKTLPGVREVHSSAIGSRAQTLVYFDATTDASSTAAALRSRLDQIHTRLPRDASKPLIGWRLDTEPSL